MRPIKKLIRYPTDIPRKWRLVGELVNMVGGKLTAEIVCSVALKSEGPEVSIYVADRNDLRIEYVLSHRWIGRTFVYGKPLQVAGENADDRP